MTTHEQIEDLLIANNGLMKENTAVPFGVSSEILAIAIKSQEAREYWKIDEAIKHLNEALWWAEQHTDSAIGRRIRDYRRTIEHASKALKALKVKP